jgi:hypothetical protein
MKTRSFRRLTCSLALLTLGSFAPNLQAGWGSLQGSNHSAAPARSSAPRPAPSRAPEPARPAEPARPPEPDHQPAPYRPPEQRPEDRAPERPAYHPAPERPEYHPAPARTPAAETDRRRMDIDADRRQTFFWSDVHRGARFDHLPDGYRRFHVRDHDYFYFGGIFYDTGPDGYVVVAPPVDAVIPELPPGAETVQDASGNVYYYAGGAYYVPTADGFAVVAPPLGVTVTEPPTDAVAVVINGVEYFQADGVCYQPVLENGVTAYLTVPQP